MRLRTKLEKTLLLPICLRSWPTKEVLRDKVKQAMADLASQERHKRINLTDPDAR